jgi:hypothetical protein
MDYLYPQYWHQKLHHRHLITFILFLAVIFQAILITGCLTSSAGSPNLYLIQFKYASYNSAPIVANGIVNPNAYGDLNKDANSTDLIMRAGYFGACAKAQFLSNGSSWHCSKNITELTQNLQADQDPFNLIYVGFQFMQKSVAAWLFVVAIIMSAFTAISIHFVDDTEGLGFPFIVGISVLSFFVLLISMVWQQSAANTSAQMITAFSDTAIQMHAGPATAGLGWTSAVLLFACSFGLVMMYLSDRQRRLFDAEIGTSHNTVQPVYLKPSLSGRSARSERLEREESGIFRALSRLGGGGGGSRQERRPHSRMPGGFNL